MKKAAIVAIAALMSVGSISSEARAGDGGAIAAGVIGGLAFGALAGAAIADSQRPAYVYDDYGYVPVYRHSRRAYRYYSYPSYSYDDRYYYYPSYRYHHSYYSRHGYGYGYGSWYDY